MARTTPVAPAPGTVSARRARRAEALADLRRREIVEAAFEEFSQRGYHETGIADIARRTGMGHGTFYRYFQNKRDILEHVITDLIDRALAALAAENAPQATETLADYRRQVARIAAALWDLFDADPRVMRMLLLQAGGVDDALEARVLGLMDTAAQVTADYLENGRRRGFLRRDLDVAATAEAVVGLIVAGVLHGLRRDDRASREPYTAAAIQLMFEGVGGERAR